MKKLLVILITVFVLSGCGTVSEKNENSGDSVLRGDIDTDVCGAITADFVYSATGKEVVKVEPDWILPERACRYYFTYDPNFNPAFSDPKLRAGGQHIFMMVEDLSVANQKKGLEILEASYKSGPAIKMENMLVYRKDGSLRDIYLIINPNRYLRMDTNSGGKGISEQELIDFAIKVAEKIQGNLSFAIKKNPIELEEERSAAELPSQEQVVRNFLDKLVSKDVSGALGMLEMTESIKQSWGVNFNTIEKLEIKKIEPVYPDEWTDSRQVFKATLQVKVNSAGEQMGWLDGENNRWITVVKQGEAWKVGEIALNP